VGESEKLTNIVAVNFTKREMLAKREHRREKREVHRVLKRERDYSEESGRTMADRSEEKCLNYNICGMIF